MPVLHGTWIADLSESKSFIQNGAFFLWVAENANQALPIKGKELKQLLSSLLNSIECDSRMISSLLPNATGKCAPVAIEALILDDPISMINNLYVNALRNEEVQFGSDLLYWHQLVFHLKTAIARNQYIPSFQENQSKAFLQWKFASHAFQKTLQLFADQMPMLCFVGSLEPVKKHPKKIIEPLSLLNHFCASVLNQQIQKTKFVQKTTAPIEDTCMEYLLWPMDITPVNIAGVRKNLFLSWQEWCNRLSVEEQGIDFILAFQLSEPQKEGNPWLLHFIVNSKSDPLYAFPLCRYWEASKAQQKKMLRDFGKNFEQSLMVVLGLTARIYNPIWSSLKTMHPSFLKLSDQGAFEFLTEWGWILQDAGFKVKIPSWYTSKGRRKAKIKLKQRSKDPNSPSGSSHLSLNALMHFEYKLSIGGQEVSPLEWEELIARNESLVKFRGEWMHIDPEEMKNMLRFWEERQKQMDNLSITDVLGMLASEDHEINFEVDKILKKQFEQLQEKSSFQLLKDPKNLAGSLRPYQQRGFSWLHYLSTLQMNPCLADDMGLGKTVQVIALLLHCKKKNNLLVVPAIVMGNWKKEVEKFAPSLKVHIHHGSLRVSDSKALSGLCETYDLIVTSYALARKDEKLFTKLTWSHLILDEAQNIKNPKAAQTKAVSKLQSTRRIALTGTPIENKLLDLWSIFNFLNPGYLGRQTTFEKRFAKPIARGQDLELLETLKKMVEPFILRRVKTDKNIINDLPEKIEKKEYIPLSKEQASLYEGVVRDVSQQLEEKEGIERSGLMLNTLMRLKQICNHPAQFLDDNSSFSDKRSNKLRRLDEMVGECLANGESILVFSQFREIVLEIERYLKTNHIAPVYAIHGQTSQKKREKMIEEFQDQTTPPSIFILSIKAGGVGITLTKASRVFHFDRWWNPAVEDQATDRAYRIGQKNSVFIHKFISTGTLEEKIDEIIEEKKKLTSSIIGSKENWLTKLDNESFKSLISFNKEAFIEV